MIFLEVRGKLIEDNEIGMFFQTLILIRTFVLEFVIWGLKIESRHTFKIIYMRTHTQHIHTHP